MDEASKELEVEDLEERYLLGQEIERLQKETEEHIAKRIELELRAEIHQHIIEHCDANATSEQIDTEIKEFFTLREEQKFNGALVTIKDIEQSFPVWEGNKPSPPIGGIFDYFDNFECRRFENVDSEKVLQECIPENSRRAYQGDIRYFGAWMKARGCDFSHPPNSNIIQRFILDHIVGFIDEEAQKVESRLINEKYKRSPGPHSLETVKRRLAALSIYCQTRKWTNPVKTEEVRMLLRQLSKKYAQTNQPKAITRNMLLHLLEKTDVDLIGVRDRALICFIFASGGRRRSEVEDALIEDLEDKEEEFLFHLRKTKTNKSGKSEPKPITGLAAKYLREWLKHLGDKNGPLFRPVDKVGRIKDAPLKGAFISRIVKKLCSKAGYDPSDFSAHSLRSGFVSQAARDGCSLPEIKTLTGHRTDAMVSRYYQQGDVLRSKAGNLL
jgi:integrase